MGVNIKSQINDPKNKKIRTIIDTPEGSITVFEPTTDDVAQMMELQDFIASANQPPEERANLEIRGQTIMKVLVPMLTDMEVPEDMSDEELQNIIDNPTLALSLVTQVLSGIVTDVYSTMMYMLSNEMKRDLLQEAVTVVSDNSSSLVKKMMLKENGGNELVRELEKAEQDVEEVKEKTEPKEDTQETVSKQPQLKVRKTNVNQPERAYDYYVGDEFDDLKED